MWALEKNPGALKRRAICLAPLQSELLQGNPEGLMDSLKTTHTGLGLAPPTHASRAF